MTVLDSRELIVLAVTGTYLQVIAAQSRVDTSPARKSPLRRLPTRRRSTATRAA